MVLYDIYRKHPVITIDSRHCPNGSIFFALKGDFHNANQYALQALENGCAYAVVDEAQYAIDNRFILVNDVLSSLQELANFHRMQMGIKIIGITGSNGKTTTKELIASVLRQKHNIHFTQGNLNNHIGVPLTLLQIKPEHQLAIIEMGANHPGEIKTLCQIAMPNFGIITNVGKAHLEGFGSFEGVKKTKAELYDFIAARGLCVFINQDNEHLKQMATKAGLSTKQQISFTLKKHPQFGKITGAIIGSDPYLRMQCQTGIAFDVNTQLIGTYNAENVMAAVTIGHFFGLNNELIRKGIEEYQPSNNRSQMTKTASNHLVVDAYNANPTSMRAAILNFAETELSESKQYQKLLVLGDMLELGDQSHEEHQTIIQLLQEKKFEHVWLVGNHFGHCVHNFRQFSDVEQVMDFLQKNKIKNKLVLIKGSRSIQLEKIIPLL